ncbi:MAG TPA: phytanoyl-CoA dioxygenase family protein [Bryobacteraceae bacterium]|nr:phytanoyl-CoA dioxygenase family protein [Bryobacteraceae bacterium]
MLTASAKQQLDELGYLVLPGLMSHELLESLRWRIEELFAEEGARAGAEFKQEPHARRLANLVNKGDVFELAIETPEVLACMAHVLGEKFKLSSLNVRAADPASDCSQPLHADSAAIADERGYWVCNSVWMLDDFTTDNGAIRMVPGSHKWRRLPQEALADPVAPHPQEQLLTGAAGTVVVMNAHMWHGATANHTEGTRRAMHAFYTRWDKPQQQYQKKLLSPNVQARLSASLRKLLALDDPLNDELSSRFSGASGFLK